MLVKIPEDIYSYTPKKFGNFTTRQVVSLLLGAVVIAPVFIVLYTTTGSIDLSGIMSCVAGVPVIMCGFIRRDGQPLEKIMQYRLEERRYPPSRPYRMANLYEDLQRAEKELKNIEDKPGQTSADAKQKAKKRAAAVAKKRHRAKQRAL